MEPMADSKLHFAKALTSGGWQQDVTISLDAGGIIMRVESGMKAAASAQGAAIPAMPNVHSHAHQRLMLGLAERAGPGTDTFWTWREVMYRFALKLDPGDLEAVAAQLYVEMLKGGYTTVGEFQYLHHTPDGTPYDNPAELSMRCLAAAEQAGIAITMLPALYTCGGFGGLPPVAGQRRFVNSLEGFLDIRARLQGTLERSALRRIGVAPHSFRAVTPELLKELLAGIPPTDPVHIHVAEQTREVEESLASCGRRPVETLLDFVDGERIFCAIHATHMTDVETAGLAEGGVIAGLCPMTEANLGDGIFPARRFLGGGGSFAVGTDSQINVSVADDLRQLEYSQRLRDRERNVLADGPGRSTGRRLFDAALKGGAKALAQPIGAIEAGKRADICVLDTAHPILEGRDGDALLDSWIFAGGQACIRDMFVAGKHVVKNRRHADEERILNRFRRTVSKHS
jgi:formimidoylglutamate deiminase